MKYGGLSRITQMEDDIEKTDNLIDIYNSIILDEVIPKNKIKDTDFLRRIIRYVIRRIAQPSSPTSLSKNMKHDNIHTEPKTIKKYIPCLIQSYILLEAIREEIPSKTELTRKKKYYVVDQGFYELNTDRRKT